YRGLIFCPGQLVKKWERELRETIPGVRVTEIESWKDLLTLDRREQPTGPEWWVIARVRAKLGPRWKPAFRRRKTDGYLHCPTCAGRLLDEKSVALQLDAVAEKRLSCTCTLPTGKRDEQGLPIERVCCSPLWQMTGEVWRYEPALYI